MLPTLSRIDPTLSKVPLLFELTWFDSNNFPVRWHEKQEPLAVMSRVKVKDMARNGNISDYR